MKSVRENPKTVLACFSLFSFFLIASVDRFLFRMLPAPLSLLADLRITSLLLVSAIYFSLKEIYGFAALSKPRLSRRVVFMVVSWLPLTAYFVLIRKVWVPRLPTWIDITAFMLTGLIAEEILFRGILFNLAERVFGARSLFKFTYPVLITSLLFGLQHLSYHSFSLNSAALTQVAYTTAMGIVFGSIKEVSGRIWPAILFHMLNNSFTLMRNL